jgi:hypothetical protein
MQFWRDIVASDIETYLRELQAALAGADPALVQDALFDAEEHLHAEMATGRDLAAVVSDYGTPQEVAAAYLGARPAAGPAPITAVETGTPLPVAGAVPPAPAASAQAAAPAVDAAAPAVAGGAAAIPGAGAPYAGPAPAAAPYGAPVPYPSVWRQIFGVFYDPWVWKSLLYMIISLATGVFYFTVVVTMISTSMGMIVLIVGLPLLLLTLGFVRGLALFEGRLVEFLLGVRMPRRPRADFPRPFFQRLWFWLKDGRTWASLVYLVLMLPIGIVYFTFAVTGLAWGLGLISLPFVQLISGHTWIHYGIDGLHEWLLPGWAMPFVVIAGFLVLLGWLHAFRWIGRGHALYAKAMLVRLAK